MFPDMRLKVLGSSSSGNGYVLYNERESLVIEAGIPIKKLKQAANFDLSKVLGVLVSHSHGDHGGRAKEYLSAAIPCFMGEETAKELGLKSHRLNVVKPKEAFTLGGFTIVPFPLIHDVQCLGYLIAHEETGLFPFITDTHYSAYKFPPLDNIMIECNYDERLLDDMAVEGETSVAVYNRVMGSHINLRTCKKILHSQDLSNVRRIVLLHLSSRHSDARAFKKEVEEETGKEVVVADRDIDINFNRAYYG